jgi:hypothetical protein
VRAGDGSRREPAAGAKDQRTSSEDREVAPIEGRRHSMMKAAAQSKSGQRQGLDRPPTVATTKAKRRNLQLDSRGGGATTAAASQAWQSKDSCKQGRVE